MKLSNLFQAIQKNPVSIKLALFVIVYLFFSVSIISVTGCAPSQRFTSSEEEKKVKVDESSTDISTTKNVGFVDVTTNEIRVLLSELDHPINFLIESPVELYSDDSRIAVINKGNRISVIGRDNIIEIKVQNNTFTSSRFVISSAVDNNMIKIDGKRYRGKLVFRGISGNMNLINQISIEDYVKGVMTKEMPLGKKSGTLRGSKSFCNLCKNVCIHKNL